MLLAGMIEFVCAQDSDLADRVTRSYFTVLSGLVAIYRSKCACQSNTADTIGPHGAGVTLWKRLGASIHPSLRSEQDQDGIGPDAGDHRCGRLQCPLHENTGALLTREIMLCVGCHIVRPHRSATP